MALSMVSLTYRGPSPSRWEECSEKKASAALASIDSSSLFWRASGLEFWRLIPRRRVLGDRKFSDDRAWCREGASRKASILRGDWLTAVSSIVRPRGRLKERFLR